MAFPTTGILDSFNRANEGPPPSSNFSGPADPGDGSLQTSSNQCVSASGYGYIWWNVAQFGPDCEAYVTLASVPDVSWNYTWVAVKLQSPGTSGIDGYEITIETQQSPTNDNVYVNRIDNNVSTQLGATINTNFAAGDGLGVGILGSAISAYRRSSGTWSSLGSRTDSTYGAGYIGVGTGTAHPLDDFGGGTTVSLLAVPRRTMAGLIGR